jgi:hypothetical protein
VPEGGEPLAGPLALLGHRLMPGEPPKRG